MIYFIETTTIAEHPWAVSLWFLYKIDRKAWPLAAEAQSCRREQFGGIYYLVLYICYLVLYIYYLVLYTYYLVLYIYYLVLYIC